MRTVSHEIKRAFSQSFFFLFFSFFASFEIETQTTQFVNVWVILREVSFGIFSTGYRVFLKRVFHKLEEKMQEKMKMTWQEDKNLVQVQQHCSVYFLFSLGNQDDTEEEDTKKHPILS